MFSEPDPDSQPKSKPVTKEHQHTCIVLFSIVLLYLQHSSIDCEQTRGKQTTQRKNNILRQPLTSVRYTNVLVI